MNIWNTLLQLVLDRLNTTPAPAAEPAPEPASPPEPEPYRVRVTVSIADDDAKPGDRVRAVPERISGSMAFFDGTDPIAGAPVWYDTLEFALPLTPWAKEGALVRLWVRGDGCRDSLSDVRLTDRMEVALTRMPPPVAPPPPGATPVWPSTSASTSAPASTTSSGAGRLSAQGRWLLADGQRLKWRGITALRLLELEVRQPAAADRYLDFCAEHRAFPRFLVMMDNAPLFLLDREEGLAALPRLAQKLKDRGLYGAAVACVGTRAIRFDWDDQMAGVGAIAEKYGNLRVAVGNELFPVHSTESSDLTPDRLLQLARKVPATVPVSLGSTHGPACEDRTLAQLARQLPNGIALAHDLRVTDENGWKWVRHPNDLAWLADDVRIWVANEEPQRHDMTPGKHLATAVVCHGIRNIGDCFHYAGGVHAQIPSGPELDAFLARKQGWNLSADWQGSYANAGQVGSPVKGFSKALRVYSSFIGHECLVVGCDAAAADIEWHPGVKETLILERDGAKVWKTTR